MLKRFSMEFPTSRQISKDIKGKRLVFSGLDQNKELDLLKSAGASNICLQKSFIKGKMEGSIQQALEGFDVCILDSQNHFIRSAGFTDDGLKVWCQESLDIFEALPECFTAGIAPTMVYDRLGKDYCIALLQEISHRCLPLFPLIYRSDKEMATTFLENSDYAFVSRDVVMDRAFMMWLKKESAEFTTVLSSFEAYDPYALERDPLMTIIQSAWKMGSQVGTNFIYLPDKNKLLKIPFENKQFFVKKYKDVYEFYGIDHEKVLAGISEYTDFANAKMWVEYSKKLDLDYVSNFWITDVEALEVRQDFVEKYAPEDHPARSDDPMKRLEEIARSDNRAITRFMALETEEGQSFVDARTLVATPCNKCSVADVCPMFKANATCAFKTFAPVRSKDDLKNMLGAVLGMQNSRLQHTLMVERLEGGELKPEVSKEIDSLFKNSEIFTKITKDPAAPPLPGQSSGSVRILGVEIDMGSDSQSKKTLENDPVGTLMKAMIGDKRQTPKALPAIDLEATLQNSKKGNQYAEKETTGPKKGSKVTHPDQERDRVINLKKQADSDILES